MKLLKEWDVDDTPGTPRMILIDDTDRKAEVACKDFPFEWSAMVFENGSFAKTMCSEKVPVPTTEVMRSWTVNPGTVAEVQSDLRFLRGQPWLKVEMVPNDGAKGEGVAITTVRLKPGPDTTLLEVFIRTKIGFRYK